MLNNWFPIMIAVGLLNALALSVLPRTSALSETPWRSELVTTMILGICIAVMARRDGKFLQRMFTVRDRPTRWIVRLLAAFTLWGLLSTLWAQVPVLPVHHSLLWTEYLLWFLFLRQCFADEVEPNVVLRAFAIVAMVIGVLCIFDYATLPDFSSLEGTIRIRYGAYAELLVTIVPLLFAFGIYAGETKPFVLRIAAASLGWLTVMLSLSKGAFLAGLIGVLLTFAGLLVFGKSQFRRWAITFAVWLALTIVVQVGFSVFSQSIPSTVDYISGKNDATRETSLARIVFWQVGLRMAEENPFLGVGADNFGVAFNRARAEYRTDHPDRPADEPVSDIMVQRAHNEPLQIAAELGAVGLVLFAAPFIVFFAFALRLFARNRDLVSPQFVGALGGIAAFAVSSMVSSFSFRLVQNGIAFFIVLAIAVTFTRADAAAKPVSRGRNTALQLALVLFFFLAIAVFATKGVAEYLVSAGDRQPDAQTSVGLYHTAARLDPAYAAAYLRSADRLRREERYGAAAADMRKAMDGGCGTVTTFATLAGMYEKAGDTAAAEDTYIESLRIFPRSVFLRVRYSLMLHNAGRNVDAESQFATAIAVESRQANGWHALITQGSVAAFYAAQNDASMAQPSDLVPGNAVRQYLDAVPAH